MTGVGAFPNVSGAPAAAAAAVVGVNSSPPPPPRPARPSLAIVMTPPQIAQRARTIAP
jgi:hypothetical protein